MLGAAGPAFVPSYCVGPLVDLTYRCILQPGIPTALHAAAVFASDRTMVNRNVPIYMQRIGNTMLSETIHVNDRFTAWGFRLSECPVCHNFDNVKSSYANGGAKKKAKKAPRRKEVRISFPLRLTCTAHKGKMPQPPCTRPVKIPSGVRAATEDGSLVWHQFATVAPPKWVWPGYEPTPSDSVDETA